MKYESPFHSADRSTQTIREKGIALVIVLCFIVLLTGVIIAFFSRAALDRQMSNASANGTKTSLFAMGAVDSITAQLKQEIAASSSATAITMPNGGISMIYTPKASGYPYNQAFTPCCNTGANADSMPNLVKISTSERGFYGNFNYSIFAQEAPILASSCSSTSSSLNGRFITASRWNKPLLLPKQNSTSTDLTPTEKFTPPTWIYVSRSGDNPGNVAYNRQTHSGNGDGAIVGRYAYTVYNEGGLLDMNVAGYPVDSGSNFDYIKPGLAYADLHQIPGISNLDPAEQDKVINAIVGWRNYASSNAQGTFPDFTSISGTDYYNAIIKNQTGFLATSGTHLNGGGSDQAFTSRQQLMDLFSAISNSDGSKLANLQNALQFMGTFSRDLSQPSYYPSPDRPKICTSSGTIANYKGNLFGGQDIVGSAYSVDPSKGLNPSFLHVRALADFTRADGSKGYQGEPLIKQRFLLKRLAWLTYQGPSANRSMSDADMRLLQQKYGITEAFLKQGTDANILKYFGLKWNAGTTGNANGCNGGFWTYEHLAVGSANANESILTLTEVAAKPYEPDFFQLLKAAIPAGALGKMSMSGTDQSTWPIPHGSNLLAASHDPLEQQTALDCNPDYQIFQIGANIIDQADVDGFSTQIRIGNSASTYHQFRGVEDQPYINSVFSCMFPVRTCKYLLTYYVVQNGSIVPVTNNCDINNYNSVKNQTYLIRQPSTDPKAVGYYSGYVGTASILDTGMNIGMAVPSIWNPHDKYNPLPSASDGLRPTKFRVVAFTGAKSQEFATGCTLSSGSYSFFGMDYDYMGQTTTIHVGGTSWGSNVTSGSNNTGELGTSAGIINASLTRSYSGVPLSNGGVDFTLDGATPRSSGSGGYTAPYTILNDTNAVITFEVPDISTNASASSFYREPTVLLMKSESGDGRNIAMAPSNWSVIDPHYKIITNLVHDGDGVQLCPLVSPSTFLQLRGNNAQTSATPPSDQTYIGIPIGAVPMIWPTLTQYSYCLSGGSSAADAPKPEKIAASSTTALPGIYLRPRKSDNLIEFNTNPASFNARAVPCAFVLQYSQSSDGNGPWVTYDVKNIDLTNNGAYGDFRLNFIFNHPTSSSTHYVDPRTARFGGMFQNFDNVFYTPPTWKLNSTTSDLQNSLPWVDVKKGMLVSMRPDAAMGFGWNNSTYVLAGRDPGWRYATDNYCLPIGLLSQNSLYSTNNNIPYTGGATTISLPTNGCYFYTDADGMLRRAMGGYADAPSSDASASTIGLPMARAEAYTANGAPISPQSRDGAQPYQYQSRPMVLNRPLRSVGELGYAFSDLPWRNLDFTFPESGFSPLLDIFTVQETSNPNGLVAGKVDLNTRNAAVIKSILSGAYTDEQKNFKLTSGISIQGSRSPLDADIAEPIAAALVARTGTNALTNISELVGKCISTTNTIPSLYTSSATNLDTTTMAYSGSACYTGFSEDLTKVLNGLNASAFADSEDPTGTYNKQALMKISRFRESTVRALSNAGTTRVWNLMIDVIAQTGRFPNNATVKDWNQFYVEGERHYWVHLAIDRWTGKVLDKQIELVSE